MTPQFHLSKLNYNLHKYTAFLSCAAILLLSIVFLQPFNSESSYAEDHEDTANGTYNGTNYSLTTTVSDLNLELKNVTPAGKAVYGKQTVNVVTTAPGGYQLYMQTSGNLAGTKDGTATSDSIAALSANNSALDTNSWGYVTAASLSSASTTLDEDMDKAATQAVWNTPPSTLTQIDATSSAATSGRDTDIYYGIKADNTLAGDNYSGTITYTTVANSDGNDGLLVTRGGSGYAGENNNTLTITTPIFTSASFATSDVVVTIKNSSGTEYTCTVSSVNTTNGVLQTVCSIPTTATASTYSVTVTVDKYGKTFTKASAFSLSSFTLSISSATPTTATANTSTSMTITINRSGPSATTAKYGTTSLSGKSNSGTKITGTVSLAAGTYTLTVTATWNGKTYTATKSSALTVGPPKEYMQDKTYANWCQSLTDYDSTNVTTIKNTTYELYDKRTNFSNEYPYYIRKLADGNCWMVENLYLEGGKKLLSTDTNLNGSLTEYSLPASSTDGFSDDTAANLYSGGRNRDDFTITSSYGTSTADGSYMTWNLAKAGTADGKNSDVCPKNWRLPENSEYNTVTNWSYSTFDTRWFADKDGSNNSATPIYPGIYISSNSLSSNGSHVSWWSSAQRNYLNGYYLYRDTNLAGISYVSKRNGVSVRCVLSAE